MRVVLLAALVSFLESIFCQLCVGRCIIRFIPYIEAAKSVKGDGRSEQPKKAKLFWHAIAIKILFISSHVKGLLDVQKRSFISWFVPYFFSLFLVVLQAIGSDADAACGGGWP